MLSLAYPWVLALIALPFLLNARKRRSTAVEAPVLPTGHWLSDLPGVSRDGRRRSLRWTPSVGQPEGAVKL